jgi:hypothetical protein
MRPSYPSKSFVISLGLRKEGIGLLTRTTFQSGMGHAESALQLQFQRNVEEHSPSFSSSVACAVGTAGRWS